MAKKTVKKSETVIVSTHFLDNENGNRKAKEWIDNKLSKLSGKLKGQIKKTKNSDKSNQGILQVSIVK